MANDSSKEKINRLIEQNLKRVYDDALSEPVPSRFEDLLAQLRRQEQAKTKEPKE